VKDALGGDRGGRHRVSRRVLDRDRARVGPRGLARQRTHRAHPHGFRRRAARRCSRCISAGSPMGWRPPGKGVACSRCSAPGPASHVGIDLAGLAVGGRPVHRAVVFGGAGLGRLDRRARAVAAVNVLNAAFMTVGALGVGGAAEIRRHLERAVRSRSVLLNLVVAVVILRTMPTSPMRDLLSVIFRAFFRLEVHRPRKCGTRPAPTPSSRSTT
jgi:hypothetical protein